MPCRIREGREDRQGSVPNGVGRPRFDVPRQGPAQAVTGRAVENTARFLDRAGMRLSRRASRCRMNAPRPVSRAGLCRVATWTSPSRVRRALWRVRHGGRRHLPQRGERPGSGTVERPSPRRRPTAGRRLPSLPQRRSRSRREHASRGRLLLRPSELNREEGEGVLASAEAPLHL